MAPSSHSKINSSDQQPRNSFPYKSRCGSSKAQLSLQKILHIILTIPSQNDSKNIPPRKMEDPPISPLATADKGLASNVKEEIHNNDGDEKGEEDYMGLLFDAAQLIFGEIKEDDQKKKQSSDGFDNESTVIKESEKPRVRNQVYLFEEEDMIMKLPEPLPEPVVRSKRGRTQVLPCKYRDSILEPLTPVSRNRSTVISNKRRLK